MLLSLDAFLETTGGLGIGGLPLELAALETGAVDPRFKGSGPSALLDLLIAAESWISGIFKSQETPRL